MKKINKHSNHRTLTFAPGLCGLTLFSRFKDSLTHTAALPERKSPKRQTDQVSHSGNKCVVCYANAFKHHMPHTFFGINEKSFKLNAGHALPSWRCWWCCWATVLSHSGLKGKYKEDRGDILKLLEIGANFYSSLILKLWVNEQLIHSCNISNNFTYGHILKVLLQWFELTLNCARRSSNRN